MNGFGRQTSETSGGKNFTFTIGYVTILSHFIPHFHFKKSPATNVFIKKMTNG